MASKNSSAATTVPAPSRQVAPPRRSPWPYVLVAFALLLGVVAGLLYVQSQGGETGPLPEISGNLPEQLRSDLQRLKDAVDA